MPEYVGDDALVATQARIRDRQGRFANAPWFSNGGRIVNYVDPKPETWPQAREIAETDGLLGLPCVPRDGVEAMVETHLGPGWTPHYWEVFLGEAADVLPVCKEVIDSVALPDGWQVKAVLRADPDTVDAVQALNVATGLAPYPAYFMRGDGPPTLTVVIRARDGRLVATSSYCMRYHAQSRFGGIAFVGLVSVDASCRGMGLGKLANALAHVHGHRQIGCSGMMQFAAPDNTASHRMIGACGLTHHPEQVFAIVTRTTDRPSR